MELKFERVGKGATLSDIRDLEQRLNVRFPEYYTAFALKFAGSVEPDRCSFEVPGGFTGYFGILFDVLPGEAETEHIGFEVPRLWFRRALPHKVVPIIRGGGGDKVCLDCRGRNASVVFYESGVCPENDDIVPLANSFTEFLEMLRKPDDA